MKDHAASMSCKALIFLLSARLSFSQSTSFTTSSFSSPFASTAPVISTFGLGMMSPSMFPAAFSAGAVSPFVGSTGISPMSFGGAGGMFRLGTFAGTPAFAMPSAASTTGFTAAFMPGFRSFGSGFPLGGFGNPMATSGNMYMSGFGIPWMATK